MTYEQIYDAAMDAGSVLHKQVTVAVTRVVAAVALEPVASEEAGAKPEEVALSLRRKAWAKLVCRQTAVEHAKILIWYFVTQAGELLSAGPPTDEQVQAVINALAVDPGELASL